ncbi:ATPase, histidine kinase-, DNA gyrase B-, and HSP90-like domain-containing protein [Isoalcanivorax pacificus W11-5]|uniref:ATPase, histidine kinase-, DNA gyrase B-, and HSP90-like domain-containing protein n=1 Tax=Isoalcanivorax pacificus W11-5 TaxID=391936 RepID=A0A0B4XK38_9GAMM|nr:ATP-binding protein [Isoalcanivorax pacificus]AJD47436.1 ATPase, histidine kinase-, DNA gyrase B-, and HSP90-like domain-containing protein [Isoalcanivorax pacificus W11-5]
MIRKLGLGVLWAVLAGLASVPLWLSPPQPDVLAITAAQYEEDGAWQAVTLPRARREAGGWEHYRMAFRLEDATQRYLFIPTISQRAIITLAGEEIADTEHRTTMIGLASGITALVPLPPRLLQPGENVIDVHLQSIGMVPAYLSPLYVGSADQLTPYYRSRIFLLEYLRLMVPAGQLLMALVVMVLWLYRPQEPLFGWLALMLVTSMFIYLGMMQDLVPGLFTLMPYLHMIGSSASAILMITVLLIAGIPPPRWLKLAALLVPAGCIVLGVSGLVSASQLVMFVNAPLNITGLLISLGITGWAAARRVSEAWLLLLPLLLAALAALHDYLVVTGRADGPIFLSVYYRPALMIGIAMILMRRLGVSLNRLDNANAYLTQRLTEQEQELARLHAEERREAARRTLADERRRLTADLHDGLSGHLASIIALSEREKSAQVERAAREALDDLRLVIHSLDIQDRELPAALAGLRERLERQLKRMGVTLDWSMARLPEIAGVTPSQALNVLRILQEAITNAIKHGQATHISVQGSDDDGHARIEVENNGLPFPRNPDRCGTGLNNMRRRIRALDGRIEIEPLEQGTRLTLWLPRQLPESSPE